MRGTIDMTNDNLITFYSEAENHFKSLSSSYDRLAVLNAEGGNFDGYKLYREKARKYMEMSNYAHDTLLLSIQLRNYHWDKMVMKFSDSEGAE